MADTYYKQDYQCSACGVISRHYIWASEGLEAIHKCKCGAELNYTHEYEKPIVEAPMIKTPTMNRAAVFADRKKRSTEHFKKEVLPTINKADRVKFAKKHGVKV